MSDTIDAIAAVCHEANRAYCDTLGDFSHAPWALAPEHAKVSARRGVAALIVDATLTPERQHALWMADKIRDGWTYGPVKDVEQKTHPSLRPYNELTIEERRKDALFQGVVRALTGIDTLNIEALVTFRDLLDGMAAALGRVLVDPATRDDVVAIEALLQQYYAAIRRA